MSKYDTIEEVSVAKYNPYHDDKGKVAKSFDEIVEVEKFNPFHDAEGKFSNANGFKSYSANPNTRAGAMAIARSSAAGHGSTLNVHRDSQGETIRRNANWLARGAQGVPQGTQGHSVLRHVVEPTAGLSGASAAGSSWQAQNQMQGRTTTNGKKPAQTTQQPAQQAQAAKPTQTQAQTQKPAQKPQAKPAGSSVKDGTADNPVNGKDLAGKFQFNANSKDYAIEQVIKAQGFDGKPTVTKDPQAFSDACRASNFIAKRGVGASNQRIVDQYSDDMVNGDFYVKCSGGSVHGYGMYAASVVANGANARYGVTHATQVAQSYGLQSGSATKIFTFTMDKSAKITTENDLMRKMKNDKEFAKACQNSGMRSSYTYDVGVYAAYKGYDAYIANGGRGRHSKDGSRSDYTVVLNRSKMILFDPN